MNFPSTLSDLLFFILTGPGAAVICGFLISNVLENIPAWLNLPMNVKFVASIVLVGTLPVLATLLLQWQGLPLVEPWVNMAFTAIIAWVASQAALIKSKRAGYGARFYTCEDCHTSQLKKSP